MKIMILILLIPIISFSQTGIIKGHVSAKKSDGKIFGASIQLINTQIGAVSDVNGNYIMKDLPPGKYVIRCTMVGSKPQADSIEVIGNNTVIIENFLLERDPSKKVIVTKQK